jgi:nucleoside-diphosphate-sugar epimerase
LAALLPAAKETQENFTDVNVEHTRRVYRAAQKCKTVTHFVALGSASEYGVLLSPITEEAEAKPQDFYGISKLAATKMLEGEAVSPLTTTLLRPCAVYGPAQTFTLFIPRCIEACILHTPFDMSLEKRRLDFLYVSELVRALMSAGQRVEGNVFEIINVGPGEAYSLREVASAIARELNGEEYLHWAKDPSEQYTRYLSVEKAKKLLGWSPSLPFVDGLHRTIEWYRLHTDDFKKLVG